MKKDKIKIEFKTLEDAKFIFEVLKDLGELVATSDLKPGQSHIAYVNGYWYSWYSFFEDRKRVNIVELIKIIKNE